MNNKIRHRVRFGLAVALVAFAFVLLPGFAGSAQAARRTLQGLVNINTATLVELQLLTGVGPAKAQRIAEYRDKHPFRTVEELGRVKGIGPKTVRKLRLYLTVHGPTTAREGAASGSPAATAAVPPDPPPALRRPDPPPAPPPLPSPEGTGGPDSLGAARAR